LNLRTIGAAEKERTIVSTVEAAHKLEKNGFAVTASLPVCGRVEQPIIQA
jgi:hypothetical protein